MNKSVLTTALAFILFSPALYALQHLTSMSVQGGISQVQDRSTTDDTTSTPLGAIQVQQQHKSVAFGSNFGAGFGHTVLGESWSFGTELRATLSEFTHTRILDLSPMPNGQSYELSHTTQISNLYQIFLKPGFLLPSNSIVYTPLVFAIAPAHITTLQNITQNNILEGVESHKSQKLPAGMIGLGLELILHPNISVYQDFTFGYLKRLELNENKSINTIQYNIQNTAHRFLFQSVLGIKWHTPYRFMAQSNHPLSGWYIGSGLGLLQANLNASLSNYSQQQNYVRSRHRASLLTPDIDIKIGRNFVLENLILFTELFAAFDPLKLDHNPDILLTTNQNDVGQLQNSLSIGPTYGILVKPGMLFLNRALYVMLGAGSTTIKMNQNKLTHPFLYLTGWGLETNLSPQLNLRSEYQIAYANRVSDIHIGNVTKHSEKLIQQKGTMSLIYYFA